MNQMDRSPDDGARSAVSRNPGVGAGWLMPDNLVRAGVLAYAPTAVIVAVGGILVLSAGVLLPLLMGLMVSLVGSHFGAGSALRSREAT